MKRWVLAICAALCLLASSYNSYSQSNQVVTSGQSTTPVTFPTLDCSYTWTNSNPTIGLPASGSGNLPSFIAKNPGVNANTATITATPAAANGFAYVTNNNSPGKVQVIDISTDKVVATINTGINSIGVAISRDGSRVYVTNQGSNTVSVINAATNQVIATYNTPFNSEPTAVEISADGKTLYVADYNLGLISVIDTRTGATITTIDVGSNSYPGMMIMSHDGSTLYVALVNAFSIGVINTTTNTLQKTVPLSYPPTGISLSPDGTKLYTENYSTSTISFLNTTNFNVTGSATVGSNPDGGAVTPDGKFIYVANGYDSTVSVVNTLTSATIATVHVAGPVASIDVSRDGGKVYVITTGGVVAVISTKSNKVITNIPVIPGSGAMGRFVGGCPTVTFTITVNSDPDAVTPPTITTTTATGAISACVGSASASPNIQKFTVSGSNLTDVITATAPPGFQISFTPGGPYGSSVSLAEAAGVTFNTPLYVRSAATDPVGNISGNVVLSTPGGTSQNVAVTGIVNPLPTVNTVLNQTVNNGAATTAVNFTGIGNNFTWTNNTPSIGLPANGTGNIASFNAVNNGAAPVTAIITVTPAPSGFAYIANFASNDVSVINTTTKAVVATIPVGSNPFGVSVSPDGGLVYVTNKGSNSVSVINSATNTVTATINVGLSPQGIVVSPDGSLLYVANFDGNNVSVINTATNTLLSVVNVNSPYGVTVSPDGAIVYVTSYNANTVSVINATTGVVAATVPVQFHPTGIAVNPNGGEVYVANTGANTVSVINATNNTVTANVQVIGGPFGLAVSPDGSRIYASIISGYFTTILTSDHETINSADNTLQGVSVSPDGSQIYYAGGTTNSVTEINSSNYNLEKTIPVGSNAISLGNFVSAGSSCTGTPTTFTITVNAQGPAITTGTVGGTISACVGSPSSSPYVQTFSVSATGLTVGITVTAPAGFEVSQGNGSGFSSSLFISETNGSVTNTTIYVRAAAGTVTGNISGNVVLSSQGVADQTVAVSGIVNPIPTVNPVPNQTINNGAATTAINFTGIGNNFTWTNNTPSIGLTGNGTGNIPSFTAVNAGTTPVTATITVVPQSVGYAYITNNTDNTVSVVDINSSTVAGTITAGKNPWGVAISPDGGKVYISNQTSNDVSVINTATNTVIATIPVGLDPEGIAVTPDGTRVYVANETSGTVSVINTTTNTITGAPIPVGSNPHGLTMSPDGSRVYVANDISQNVSVISTATNAVIATIPAESAAFEIAVTPDGTRAYVANRGTGEITVINTITNAAIATIPVGSGPTGITASPDGSKIYVSNEGSDFISVISTVSNTVTGTITANYAPDGISVSPDGSKLYVCGFSSNDLLVINTATGALENTIAVGRNPVAYGNFVAAGGLCSGAPIIFTITVLQSQPGITAGAISGSISACLGSSSASPNIVQFTVTGTALTGDITATAPAGFEVSLSSVGGFGSSITISPTGGTISNTTVYVRSAASASGNILGNVVLSSPGAQNQSIAVSGIVNPLPVVNPVPNQTVTGGSPTTAINFTGSGSNFIWTNDTPGIGLPANGAGNIASFTPSNTSAAPVVATITVTPFETSSAGCSGIPVSFTITVNPQPPPSFTVTADLQGMTTTYGAPSASESFTISGANLIAGVLVTAPPGFEVSSDNIHFSPTVTVGSAGSINAAPVYVRLAATTPAGTSYTGNIVLTTSAVADIDVNIPNSVVNKAPLIITADNKTKPENVPNPELTVTYTGFVNGDGPGQLTTLPAVTTTATTGSAVGEYTITATGAQSPNYTFTYVDGTLTVAPSLQFLNIPNAFTPNGDGVNDIWNIPQLAYYPNCLVSIFTRYGSLVFQSKGYGTPWNGTYKGSQVPVATYYYIIDPKQDGQQPLSGFVAVLR